MNRFFEFFARRHKLATLSTIMILLLGLMSVRTLKRDQFPKIDLAQMDIRTVYPGASPEDVELNVTNKLEDALKEATGIDRIISSSFENRSEIEVYLDPDVKEMDEVKQNIRDAVAGVTDLPMEVTESPEVDEITTANIPIFEMGISGDIPYGSLREIARDLEKKVKSVAGVSDILKYGYRAREVIVEVSPHSLDYYQIPLRGIIQAIAARNIRQTGGTFESYTSEKNVVTLAQFKEPAEVGNVIVRSTFDGPQITVKDLAIVREDFEEESLITRVNGIKAITFLVYKKESADAVRTADAVKRMIREEAERGGLDTESAEGKSIPEMIKGFFKGRIEEQATVQYGAVKISYANDISPQVRSRFQILLSNGVIGLVGVVVNDSLVLVSHINELVKQKPGIGLRELVARGTADRLRAILLTTLTTTAGVLPLAYGIGGYDLYMAPMALTLGYGLLLATPLTLVLVPSLYLIGSDMGKIFG